MLESLKYWRDWLWSRQMDVAEERGKVCKVQMELIGVKVLFVKCGLTILST